MMHPIVEKIYIQGGSRSRVLKRIRISFIRSDLVLRYCRSGRGLLPSWVAETELGDQTQNSAALEIASEEILQSLQRSYVVGFNSSWEGPQVHHTTDSYLLNTFTVVQGGFLFRLITTDIYSVTPLVLTALKTADSQEL